jgi:tRNA pseudouridine55 synthase
MINIFSEDRKPDFLGGEVIVIDKDKDWSSYDVIRKIKSLLRYKLDLKKIKIGHAGTLDPLATGVLVVCTGKATKTISEIQASEKEYFATIKLGETTPSYDMETPINQTFETDNLSENKIIEVLNSFKGNILQTPPIYSAVWHNGKRAYEFARKGKEIELLEREVFIKEIVLEKFFLPFINIKITCSTGTYIRSLANDIGKKLDNGAFLYYLRRIRSGNFSENESIKINEFENILNKM